MTAEESTAHPLKVAVVGAGPAGFYSAAQLLSGKALQGDVRVDLFDRLPTPYGLVRFGLFLFPEAANWFAPALLTLGVIGITYGAIVATMQKDLKQVIAYSSVAHLGFIVLGTFALTRQSLTGGVLQMINHGLSTGALFLLVGFIVERVMNLKSEEVS